MARRLWHVSIALLCISVVIAATGGWTLHIAGTAVSIRNPDRIWLLGVLLAAVAFWRAPAAAPRARQQSADWQTAVALLIAGVVLIACVRFGPVNAGGADSTGYVQQADLWRTHHLKTPIALPRTVPWPRAEWTLTPLGSIPGPDEWQLVPRYSPGLPLLMAAAKSVAGQRAIFWVVPLSAAALVWLTFAMARELGFDRWSIGAAILMATRPTVLFMSMNAMSDIPLATAWALAFYGFLRRTRFMLFVAGVGGAIAIAIRPNLAFLAAILGVAMLVRSRADRQRLAAAIGDITIYAVPIVAATAGIAVLNRYLYGSPLSSGYGTLAEIFSFANFWPNVRHYAGALWTAEGIGMFAGAAAIVAPVAVIWGPTRRIELVAASAMAVATWLLYCTYMVFDSWWSMRFMLLAWPFFVIGVVALLKRMAELTSTWAAGPVISWLIVVAMANHGLAFARDSGTFQWPSSEWRFAAVAEAVRDRTDEHSVIVSMMHSGSLTYYAGRDIINYDSLDASWLDRAVEWAIRSGRHPYAVLEEWEVDEFRKRFPGQSAAGLRQPTLTYRGSATVFLFDLDPASTTAASETIVERNDRVRAIEPRQKGLQ